MPIIFNGTTLNWYTHTVVFNGTTVSSPTATGLVKFGTTDVFGISNFSPETTLFNFQLAPDSNTLVNGVNTIRSNYLAAFVSQSYTQGPGQDTTWTYVLRKGYRMVTSDGTFEGNNSTSHFLYTGQTVTGADTSHNGSTDVSLRRDNGI